jgi:hypothetical protein
MKSKAAITASVQLWISFLGMAFFAVSHYFIEINSFLDHLVLSGVAASGATWLILSKAQVFTRIAKREFTTNFRYVITINCVLGLFIYCTVPFQIIGTVDRSRSLFIFEWVQCAPTNSTYQSISNKIETTFGKETSIAFDLRLTEQIKRGFMKEKKKKLELTTRGQIVFATAVTVSKIFSLKGWKENFLWNNEKCGL